MPEQHPVLPLNPEKMWGEANLSETAQMILRYSRAHRDKERDAVPVQCLQAGVARYVQGAGAGGSQQALVALHELAAVWLLAVPDAGLDELRPGD